MGRLHQYVKMQQMVFNNGKCELVIFSSLNPRQADQNLFKIVRSSGDEGLKAQVQNSLQDQSTDVKGI